MSGAFLKKRKTSGSLSVKKILTFQDKKWLIEWDDNSRTWESFEKLKDEIVFREYIEDAMKDKISSYIG